MHRHVRAQTSAEFMLMMGVLLILALVLVALLTASGPAISDPRVRASQSYWAGTASPLQVRDFSLDSYRSPTQAAANLTLVIKNPTSRDITIRNITLSPGTFRNVYYADGSSAGMVDSLSVLLIPGEETTLIVQHYQAGGGAYLPPKVGEFSLGFKYDSALGPGFQNGSMPIVVANKMH